MLITNKAIIIDTVGKYHKREINFVYARNLIAQVNEIIINVSSLAILDGINEMLGITFVDRVNKRPFYLLTEETSIIQLDVLEKKIYLITKEEV